MQFPWTCVAMTWHMRACTYTSGFRRADLVRPSRGTQECVGSWVGGLGGAWSSRPSGLPWLQP
eukprot:10548183-Heterocapsa_arctica.AAC.1